MTNDAKTAPDPASEGRPEPKPRFLDKPAHRSIPLGQVTTDEEARLAAEIEKLRD